MAQEAIVRHVEGRYELATELEPSYLYNKDLAPVKIERRDWGYYEYISLWVGMSVCVPTWMLGASFIAAGFSWWVAVVTILLGNIIVLIPMILNSYPGAKYGIPYPVLLRSSFGIYGANIPAILRAIVGCGWFGIQTWVGAMAIDGLLSTMFPGWASVGGHLAISYIGFWALNMWICWVAPPWKGMPGIKIMEDLSSPILMLIGIGLLIWGLARAGGWGPIFSQPGTAPLSLWPAFLTAMVAYWSTMALNIADLTRFAKNQRVQWLGQALGLPTTMGVYSFFGIAVTSATVVIFGQPIWDPVQLMIKTGNAWFIFVGLVFVVLATLTTNVAANIVAPANDFSNLAPKYISWRIGALITGIIGTAIQPWRLLASYGTYIFDWLGIYGAMLGPIGGIMIVDYWICRRQELSLADLYKTDGIYTYWKGFNPAGVIALVAGVLVALTPAFSGWRWFIGLMVGAIVYYVLWQLWVSKYRTREETRVSGTAA